MKTTISRLLSLQNLELHSPEERSPEAQSLRKQIPADVLVRFDRFLDRGKKGVAEVKNGVCRGCQIALPVGVVNSLIQGQGASVCGNCGRYLYLPETDAVSFQSGLRADTITVAKSKAPTLRAKRGRKAKTNDTVAEADSSSNAE